MSALAECPYCAPDEKCAVCLAFADELTAAAWDSTKHPRHPKGDKQGGEFAPKSQGHLLFADKWEYFQHEGDVYRAPLNAPIGTTGFRQGARFEFPVSQIAYRQEHGVYPFTQGTFIGLQGFERGPGKVTIEGDRPRMPVSDVFQNEPVTLDRAVTDWVNLREQMPDKELVRVAELVPTQDQMSAVRVQEYVTELRQDGNLDELLDSTRVVEGDDGRLYVADGHNRVGAALELGYTELPLPVIRPIRLTAAAWEETRHPRHPAGSSEGGEFTRKGAGVPKGFPMGVFEPDDPKVKFWPNRVGAYSGFVQDAPYGPFWKALVDPKTGDELAFWFADKQGLPHHSSMQHALGHVPSDRVWFTYSGYGNIGEIEWGESRMSPADRARAARGRVPGTNVVALPNPEQGPRVSRGIEVEREIVRRHRRDIKDANEMLPPSRAMAAAAVEPDELTPEAFNAIVASETAGLDRYEEQLAAHYRRVIRRVGKALAARFREVAPEREALAAAAPAEWNPPTVAELLAAIERVDAAVDKAEKIQAAAFEQVVEGILRRLGISFEVRALLTQALLNTLGARAVEMIEGIRVPVARAIANSYLNGLSVPQTADAIQAAVDGLSRTQATMLARNDLVGLANGGSLTSARIVQEKFPQVALGYKEWLATEDERTRPTHHEASGQRVPLATPFVVGGAALAYPGDPSGPDGEVINCRCTVVYFADAKVDAVTAAVEKAAAVIRRAIDEAIVDGVEAGLTAAFIESQHPRDPGGEGGGEFIPKGTTAADEGEKEKEKKRLKLKEPEGSTKRQTEATVKKNVQKVMDDVADFYGADRKSEAFYEPEATGAWGTDARALIPPSQAEFANPKQEVWYGEKIMDARDPDMGVYEYRKIAHEAIHANVSGQRFTHDFYHDYEEGASEILSINYWAERGQEFDHRDAVRVDGRWTDPGAESLAHSVVYREQVADLMRRSASSVGWDRPKIVQEVHRVVTGDSNVKLKFRDSTDPEFKPPAGVADDAVGMIHWLIDKPPVTGAAWREELHPRDPGGEGGGQWIAKGEGDLPPGFPQGIFEPGDRVKFWPQKMGAYFENGRDMPMWKAILDDDGNEVAFWFVDPSGYPHHAHVERALGMTGWPVSIAGWGNNVDVDWLRRLEMPPGGAAQREAEIEAAKQVPIRHRRDIGDAAEMVTDDTRLVAAAEWDEALFAAAWEEYKHPRHPKGTHLGGQFSPKDYYYGVGMAREDDDPNGKQIGWQAYRMQRGMPGAKFDAAGKRVVGVVREEYADALADARAAFEDEIAADAEGMIQREQELIQNVDMLRTQPGQGSRFTRTTETVKDENGEILRGTRDALQIQADEAGVPIAEYDEWTDTRMRELTSPGLARVAVRTDALDDILDDGQFLTVHDDAHSPGDQRSGRSPGYAEARHEMEMRLYGDHPVYGYVGLDDEDLDGSHVKAFGNVKVTLKDSVRARTTVTYSDSMYIDAGGQYSDVIPRPIDSVDHRAVASWMNLGGVEVPVTYKGQEPRPMTPETSLPPTDQKYLSNMRRSGQSAENIQHEYERRAMKVPGYHRWRHGDFIEAQIHGGVYLDDIERVDFPPNKPPSQATIDRLQAHGIPWTVGGPDAA